MKESISVMSARTEDLSAETRAAIIHLCITAHHEDDFTNLFSYIPSGGIHVLAYRAHELVSHAVVTTRWLQPEGLPVLRTAYLDAVATLPVYQGQGIGSTLMRHLASVISDYEIACLETDDRVSFYAQVGWELWQGALAGRRATELVPTPDQQGIMILRLARTPALDLASSLTIEYDGRIW
jgi:aminoglycoside 2'-N-acetyltransferase I